VRRTAASVGRGAKEEEEEGEDDAPGCSRDGEDARGGGGGIPAMTLDRRRARERMCASDLKIKSK
jgi:hypothetical protein|tara:strand:+ start:887 stop:1081 length:195 start_codon:yes stop_codon:yes gene_type:complete